ncbi:MULTISPECIES: hypothetical protein [Micromonospora]|uniref:Uncharacterized protein n=1 Tax=Micromonospora haikouensis TaxID=686309 RepID=A0A0D0UW47_9ACTN|nr:hypothetical protein [Micromonospora haikouensis]KIR62952.1 hypothetical protein TK50_18695 [Micromonospora haikouensis]
MGYTLCERTQVLHSLPWPPMPQKMDALGQTCREANISCGLKDASPQDFAFGFAVDEQSRSLIPTLCFKEGAKSLQILP